MSGVSRSGSSSTAAILWLVVLLELVSPLPAVLTFGAIYVLLFRPPWFGRMVRELYAGD